MPTTADNDDKVTKNRETVKKENKNQAPAAVGSYEQTKKKNNTGKWILYKYGSQIALNSVSGARRMKRIHIHADTRRTLMQMREVVKLDEVLKLDGIMVMVNCACSCRCVVDTGTWQQAINVNVDEHVNRSQAATPCGRLRSRIPR